MSNEAFEKWISSPPFEKSVIRNPNDPDRYAWPGQYQDISVELAWEAWQSASAARIAELEADCKVMAEGLTCLIAAKYREG